MGTQITQLGAAQSQPCCPLCAVSLGARGRLGVHTPTCCVHTGDAASVLSADGCGASAPSLTPAGRERAGQAPAAQHSAALRRGSLPPRPFPAALDLSETASPRWRHAGPGHRPGLGLAGELMSLGPGPTSRPSELTLQAVSSSATKVLESGGAGQRGSRLDGHPVRRVRGASSAHPSPG